jgi:O-antigen ligase
VDWRVPRLFDLPVIYAREYPRLFESTVPNVLAGALAPLVPLALSLLKAPVSRIRVIGAVMLAPIVIVVLLLQSRGALFGLGLGLVVWLCLLNRWFIPVAPVAALVLLLLYRQLGGPPPVTFLYGPVGHDLAETVGERDFLFRQGTALLLAHPVLGIGLGAYETVAPYAPPFSPVEPGPVNPHTHNVLVQVGLDTGLIGLVSFASILALAVYAGWLGYRRTTARMLALGVLAAFVVMLAHGTGDSAVWGFKASIILWLVCACALVFDKIEVEL